MEDTENKDVLAKLKGAGVPLITMTITIVGGFIVHALNNMADEMRAVREYQIRSEEKMASLADKIDFQSKEINGKIDRYAKELDEVKQHVYRWE